SRARRRAAIRARRGRGHHRCRPRDGPAWPNNHSSSFVLRRRSAGGAATYLAWFVELLAAEDPLSARRRLHRSSRAGQPQAWRGALALRTVQSLHCLPCGSGAGERGGAEDGLRARSIGTGAHPHEALEVAGELRLIVIMMIERGGPRHRWIEHEAREAAQKTLAAQQQFRGKAECAAAQSF